MGINTEEIYITNIIKCRPLSNRILQIDEVTACLNYLRNQVILIQPKVIVLLGNTVLKNILGKEYDFTTSRGKLIEKKNILYIPTWSLLDLVRDESKKIQFWKMQTSMQEKHRK